MRRSAYYPHAVSRGRLAAAAGHATGTLSNFEAEARAESQARLLVLLDCDLAARCPGRLSVGRAGGQQGVSKL
eukprot:scaffold17138_cov82-Isochrysis_galbana.AAC.2